MGQRTDWINSSSAKCISVARAQQVQVGLEPQTPGLAVMWLTIQPKGYTLGQVARTYDQLESW